MSRIHGDWQRCHENTPIQFSHKLMASVLFYNAMLSQDKVACNDAHGCLIGFVMCSFTVWHEWIYLYVSPWFNPHHFQLFLLTQLSTAKIWIYSGWGMKIPNSFDLWSDVKWNCTSGLHQNFFQFAVKSKGFKKIKTTWCFSFSDLLLSIATYFHHPNFLRKRQILG